MNPLSTRTNRWRPITVFNLLVGLLFSLSTLAQPAFLKEGLTQHITFSVKETYNKSPGMTYGLGPNELGRSAVFNGTSSYIEHGFPNTWFHGQNRLTISAWVKPIGDGFLVLSTFGPKNWDGSGTEGQRIGILAEVGANKIKWETRSGGVGAAGGAGQVQTESLLNKWSHIAWTYDLTAPANNAVIYLNGKPIYSQKTDAATFTAKSQLTYSGGREGFINFDSSGLQDGVFLGSAGEMYSLRIYNRTLNEIEIKALYDYESAPQQINPRIATSTAQVVNGFVVGATITDGGYGYVENPVVTITGGGGTGAKATATQFNGVVTSITITNPGIGYTSAPTITIAPPPFPPRKATSTAQIVNGFVVGTKITDSGFGYDSPPTVLIVGGGGSGATAVATVANGVVTGINITNPGTGYTSAPVVRIASPPFAPKLGIETSKVFVRMSVVLGRKYQLEASTDLNTWTTTGPAFIAQDEELAQEFDVNQVGRYFRINQVP